MGFQHKHQEAHKLAGMLAASLAPNTPEHLRPHLKKLVSDEPIWKVLKEELVPEKGDIVEMRDGQKGTVVYVHPNLGIVRLKTEDGKKLTVSSWRMKNLTKQ